MAKHCLRNPGLLLFVMLTIPASMKAQNALGSAHVRSTVSSQDGKPISGATIAYHRIVDYLSSTDPFWSHGPKLAPGEAYVDGELTTDKNGYFDIGGLTAGNYLFCVRSQAGGYLDPCNWSRPVTIAGLVASEIRDIPNIQLTAGAVLTVHVNDPAGVLRDRAGITAQS